MPGKCQMLSRYDNTLCSDALAKGSSLRTQTDGSSALPRESSLLAIGTESAATSKEKKGHFTKTSSISLQYPQAPLQPSPCVRSPLRTSSQCFQASKPWLSGNCTQATSGKKRFRCSLTSSADFQEFSHLREN